MDEFIFKNTKILYKYIECDSCGESNPPTKCSRCKMVFYCNAKCQKKHWKVHKQYCRTRDDLKKSMYGNYTKLTKQELAASAIASNSSCGICLEEEMKEKVILPTCGHAFCYLCLKEWQNHNNVGLCSSSSSSSKPKQACPLCRTEITENVTEIAANRAILLSSRATCLPNSEQQKRNELYQEALDEIEKILKIDENSIPALIFKGEMVMHFDPQEAVSVCKKVLELDRKATEHYKLLEDMKVQISAALEIEDIETTINLCKQFDEIKDNGGRPGVLGSGPFRLYDVKLILAEAYEKATLWNEAKQIYFELINGMEELTDVGYGKSRMIFFGMSRCAYHLGLYDMAIDAGETALAMNRHYPGVHQLIAQPLQKQGRFNEAVQVMVRSILYERSFDDSNREANVTLLEGLCRDGNINL